MPQKMQKRVFKYFFFKKIFFFFSGIANTKSACRDLTADFFCGAGSLLHNFSMSKEDQRREERGINLYIRRSLSTFDLILLPVLRVPVDMPAVSYKKQVCV